MDKILVLETSGAAAAAAPHRAISSRAGMGPDGPDLPAVSRPGPPCDLSALGTSGTVPAPSVLHRVRPGGPESVAPVGPVREQGTVGSLRTTARGAGG